METEEEVPGLRALQDVLEFAVLEELLPEAACFRTLEKAVMEGVFGRSAVDAVGRWWKVDAPDRLLSQPPLLV